MKNYICFLMLYLSLTAFAADLNSKTLKISDLKGAAVLTNIGQYQKLEKLTIVCLEDLKELPESLGELKNLKELNLDNGNGCSMNVKLPESIGNLSQLKILNLAGAQDNRLVGKKETAARAELPQALVKLNSLMTLDLSRNGYSEIPEVVSKLTALKNLKLNFNSFERLPDWLKDSKITKIFLGDNCKISGNAKKQIEIKKQFPKIHFDFTNEYDCE